MAVLALEMKVLTQRDGSKSLDLTLARTIAPCAATSAPAAWKLAQPSVTRLTLGWSARLAQAAKVSPV